MRARAASGRGTHLRDRALPRAFFALRLLTLKVIAGIHWEALKIWHKGALSPATRTPTQGETSS